MVISPRFGTFGNRSFSTAQGNRSISLNHAASFGGGNNETAKENAALQAKVASLEAERYTDGKISELNKENVAQLKEFYGRFEAVAAAAATAAAEIKCLNQKLETYEISQREIQKLEKQIVDNRFDRLENQVIAGNQAALGRFAAIEAQIASFTKTVIPKTAICDIGKNCFEPQQ